MPPRIAATAPTRITAASGTDGAERALGVSRPRQVTIISDSAMAGVRWNGALGGFRGFDAVPLLESCRRLVHRSCNGREGYRPRTAYAEILAQPPGKRLAGVHLLSGGEKALSAIALLFAIFRYQPSPFCLLDEVDAALDESNVGRFARMLSEYAQHTQFIIVTHNKLTMEAADVLYGVTMEEPCVSRLISLQLD